MRALLRLAAFPDDVVEAPWLEHAGSCRAAAYAELMQQVALGDADRVERMLAFVGRDSRPTDLADFSGDTPLHWASSFGQVGVVEVLTNLCGEGAVNAVNDDGATPLHEACKGSHKQIVQILLEHGADADAVVGDTGKTALDLAKDESVKSLLLEKISVVEDGVEGAKREEEDDHGKTKKKSATAPHIPPPPPPPVPKVAVCRAPMLWPPPRRCRLFNDSEEDLHVSAEKGSVDVGVETASPVFAEAVGYLSQILSVRLDPVVPGDARYATAPMKFSLCDMTTSGPESYRLAVSSRCARLIAADSSGLRYGVATLAQLLRFYATADGQALKLPAVAVDDGPGARVRATVIDLRAMSGISLPRLLDDLYRLASWRINTVYAIVDDSVEDTFVETVVARCVLLGTIDIVPTWFVDSTDLPKRFDQLLEKLCGTGGGDEEKRNPSKSVCRGAALKLPTQWVDGDFGDDDGVVKKFSRYAEHLASVWPSTTGTLWLWGAGERATAACEAVLESAVEAAAEKGSRLNLTVACVSDSARSSYSSSKPSQSSLAEAARLANARAFSSDCVIVGGADSRRPTAMRQAPLIASLVVAARSCRAERAAGILVRGSPTEPQLATYAKPFSDATTMIGAGLAWRADAGKDISQSELEAVVAAHLWRYDPPVAGSTGDAALEVRKKQLAAFFVGDSSSSDQQAVGVTDADRRAAAASALVCGRDERRNTAGDGQARSLLAECQKGDHFVSGPSDEDERREDLVERLDDDECELWSPAFSLRSLTVGDKPSDDEDDESDEAIRAAAAAAAISKKFVSRMATASREIAQDESRSLALRMHLKRLSHVVKNTPEDRSDDLWQPKRNGFFFSSSKKGAQYGDEEEELVLEDDDDEADDDNDEPVFFFDRGADPAPLELRLRRVVDELRVSTDLLRWMARLRILLIARAREATENGPDSPTEYVRLVAILSSSLLLLAGTSSFGSDSVGNAIGRSQSTSRASAASRVYMGEFLFVRKSRTRQNKFVFFRLVATNPSRLSEPLFEPRLCSSPKSPSTCQTSSLPS